MLILPNIFFILPVSLINDISILGVQNSLSPSASPIKLSNILSAIRPPKNAFSVVMSVDELSLVLLPVRPRVFSLSLVDILAKLSDVAPFASVPAYMPALSIHLVIVPRPFTILLYLIQLQYISISFNLNTDSFSLIRFFIKLS